MILLHRTEAITNNTVTRLIQPRRPPESLIFQLQ